MVWFQEHQRGLCPQISTLHPNHLLPSMKLLLGPHLLGSDSLKTLWFWCLTSQHLSSGNRPAYISTIPSPCFREGCCHDWWSLICRTFLLAFGKFLLTFPKKAYGILLLSLLEYELGNVYPWLLLVATLHPQGNQLRVKMTCKWQRGWQDEVQPLLKA